MTAQITVNTALWAPNLLVGPRNLKKGEEGGKEKQEIEVREKKGRRGRGRRRREKREKKKEEETQCYNHDNDLVET